MCPTETGLVITRILAHVAATAQREGKGEPRGAKHELKSSAVVAVDMGLTPDLKKRTLG
jgi:hypothetical protein